MSDKLYEGTAEIIDVIPEDLKEYQTKQMTPDVAASAFNIIYKVKTPDGDILTVEVEVSKRELRGKMLEIYSQRVKDREPTQMDVALATLHRQGLISSLSEDAVAEAIDADLVGRKVNVAQKDGGTREDGTKWPPRTFFTAAPARIAGDELAARIAKLTGKKPPKIKTPKPAPAPAPAQTEADIDGDDNTEMPF